MMVTPTFISTNSAGRFPFIHIFTNTSVQFSSVTQSCPTLCDPIDCSLPGSSVHGSFPGNSPGVNCHFLLQFRSFLPLFYNTTFFINQVFHWSISTTVYCCSVTQLCLTLYDPMDCSTPGFPVLHHFPKLAQTHAH